MNELIAIGTAVVSLSSIDFVLSNDANNPSSLHVWRDDDEEIGDAVCAFVDSNGEEIETVLESISVRFGAFLHIGKALVRDRCVRGVYLERHRAKSRWVIYVEISRPKGPRIKLTAHCFEERVDAEACMTQIKARLAARLLLVKDATFNVPQRETDVATPK